MQLISGILAITDSLSKNGGFCARDSYCALCWEGIVIFGHTPSFPAFRTGLSDFLLALAVLLENKGLEITGIRANIPRIGFCGGMVRP